MSAAVTLDQLGTLAKTKDLDPKVALATFRVLLATHVHDESECKRALRSADDYYAGVVSTLSDRNALITLMNAAALHTEVVATEEGVTELGRYRQILEVAVGPLDKAKAAEAEVAAPLCGVPGGRRRR